MRRRSRWVLVGTGAGLIAAGLMLRGIPGVFGDLAGGVLYAALVFVLIAVLFPAASGVRIGSAAFLLCAAVELLQLTGLPLAIAGVVPPLRLVLGTTFVATDLVAYAIGAACSTGVDLLLRRRFPAGAE